MASAAIGPARGERPKAPGVVVLVLTLAVTVLVAVIGITARAAPPPTVAQFAPQAVQQIKQAPDQQNSEFGEGQGVNGVGQGGVVTTTTSTSTTLPGFIPPDAPKSELPVTRRCVGNPPRQIEDTQSPPCVPFWQGDNGGATSKGVTRDTIRIATPGCCKAEFDALQNFFNKRFEFYGRKLQLFNPGVGNSPDPEIERQDAAKVDAQIAFASTGYSYNHYYTEELARRKVISVTGSAHHADHDLKQWAPYGWQYMMDLDNQLDTIGAWVCKRLANRKAFHAGQADYQQATRKFGVVGYRYFPETPLQYEILQRRLEGCGAKADPIIDNGNIGNATSPTEAQNTALQLKRANVTTVICTCNNFQLAVLMRGATAQAYFPEWIGGSYIENDNDSTLHTNQEQAQMDHMFGLTHQPREVRQENMPASWAVKEGSGQPDKPIAPNDLRTRRFNYRELLLIASGIQMAGPNLTPETFEQALQRTKFPNPDDDPFYEGKVGFAGDHTMTDDVAEWYWSSQAISPHPASPGGAICYIDHGARRTANTFPTTDPPLGKLPCDSRDV